MEVYLKTWEEHLDAAFIKFNLECVSHRNMAGASITIFPHFLKKRKRKKRRKHTQIICLFKCERKLTSSKLHINEQSQRLAGNLYRKLKWYHEEKGIVKGCNQTSHMISFDFHSMYTGFTIIPIFWSKLLGSEKLSLIINKLVDTVNPQFFRSQV